MGIKSSQEITIRYSERHISDTSSVSGTWKLAFTGLCVHLGALHSLMQNESLPLKAVCSGQMAASPCRSVPSSRAPGLLAAENAASPPRSYPVWALISCGMSLEVMEAGATGSHWGQLQAAPFVLVLESATKRKISWALGPCGSSDKCFSLRVFPLPKCGCIQRHRHELAATDVYFAGMCHVWQSGLWVSMRLKSKHCCLL